MVELGDEHRRHAVERGASLGFDRLQRGVRVEALAEIDHRRAERHRESVPKLERRIRLYHFSVS